MKKKSRIELIAAEADFAGKIYKDRAAVKQEGAGGYGCDDGRIAPDHDPHGFR